MKKFIKEAKKEIPSVDEIINFTWERLNLEKDLVINKFGEILIKFDEFATNLFKEYERKSLEKLAKLWIEKQKGELKSKLEKLLKDEDFVEKLSKIFVDFALLVQQLEKDLGNMRKARGGKTFEKVVEKLLKFIDIKCEIPKGEIKKKLRRIDIVIPSGKVAIETPDKAIFITCKRTLRERWKQEVPSVGPNQRVYLLTIDNELSETKAKEIKNLGLIVYIKDNLKEEKFKDLPWVRKLSDLPKDINL